MAIVYYKGSRVPLPYYVSFMYKDDKTAANASYENQKKYIESYSKALNESDIDEICANVKDIKTIEWLHNHTNMIRVLDSDYYIKMNISLSINIRTGYMLLNVFNSATEKYINKYYSGFRINKFRSKTTMAEKLEYISEACEFIPVFIRRF